MAVPKRRTSAIKRDKRRAHDALTRPARDRLPAVRRARRCAIAPARTAARIAGARSSSVEGRPDAGAPAVASASSPGRARSGSAWGATSRRDFPAARRDLRGGRRAPRLRALAALLRGTGGRRSRSPSTRSRRSWPPASRRSACSRRRRASRRVAVAGHSLGRVDARWSRRARSRSATPSRGVRERGRLMQEAVPAGVGAMAAVIGLDAADASRRSATRRAGGEVLAPANLNGAGQVVVAGHARRGRAAGRAGARRARAARSGSP